MTQTQETWLASLAGCKEKRYVRPFVSLEMSMPFIPSSHLAHQTRLSQIMTVAYPSPPISGTHKRGEYVGPQKANKIRR